MSGLKLKFIRNIRVYIFFLYFHACELISFMFIYSALLGFYIFLACLHLVDVKCANGDSTRKKHQTTTNFINEMRNNNKKEEEKICWNPHKYVYGYGYGAL